MPRDLPLGNGRLLINFDAEYHIRDFYYPSVGGENHSAGHSFRFGVWTEGKFGWVHDADWSRSLDYEYEPGDTMVTRVSLACDRLQLALRCRDAVDFHESVYLRHVVVENRADRDREVRLFFHHDFHISDWEVGDTAYFQPYANAVIHYKGKRYFLVNARTADGRGLSDFATGQKETPGHEGTWRDAEDDGKLGRNPIAQGSVDSTVAVTLSLPARGTSEMHYWICVSTNHRDAIAMNDLVLDKGPETLIRRTADYWRLWVNKDETDFNDLPGAVVRLYKRSLLVIRTQIDDGGAIIAANDTDITQFNRDTYSYMWPRDGALAAHALDFAGYVSLSGSFFRFVKPLMTREGFFLHKYNPDGSAGSSWQPWFANGTPQIPIQEDETALVLWALWKRFEKYRDVEEVKPLYRDLIVRGGEFMAQYVDEAHDLPLPSYDLWEERRGVHAWTVGTVYGGLMAAQNFAQCFGENDVADQMRGAAERFRRGADKWLWRPELDRFARSVGFADGKVSVDQTLDSSIVGLVLFGMYDPDDARIASTCGQLYERLWIKTDVGGMARYEDDYYHQVTEDVKNVPGNPWFVCTLWLAQWWIARSKSDEELARVLPLFQWVAEHALPSGVLAEQVDPYTHAPLSVSPLTWSHAALVTAVVEYLDRKTDLHPCARCGQPLFTKEGERLRKEREHRMMERELPG